MVSTTFCNRTAERTRTNSGQPSFAVCYLVKFSLRPKEDAAYYYCNGMPVVLYSSGVYTIPNVPPEMRLCDSRIS